MDFPNIENIRDDQYTSKIQLIIEYEYDIVGNKVAVVHPRAFAYLDTDSSNRSKYTTKYIYDQLNRLEKTIWKYKENEVYKQYYYDEFGNKVKEINEKGNVTTYTYDNMNRLKTIKDSLGNTMTYNYDLSSNKTSETNALNHTITYTYDKLNRLEKTIDPYGIVVSKKVYDENGNLIKSIDSKGYLSAKTDDDKYGTEYEYDLVNRLVKIIYPENYIYNNSPIKSNKTYEYNQYSEKIKEIDGLKNVTKYKYNNSGRLITVIDGLDICTKYSYDIAGNKLTMNNGKDQTTTYIYGDGGLLIKVGNADDRYITHQYDLDLNLVKKIDKNGNEILYTYDQRGLLLTKDVPKTGDNIAYDYDSIGNRISMIDSTGNSEYIYDSNNKLICIIKDDVPKIKYIYDEIGNLIYVQDEKGFETIYTYDKSSRMKTVGYNVLGTTKTTIYSYDENGNRKKIIYEGGVTEEYTYDKNNKLNTIINKKPNGHVISIYSYTYDLVGRKKTKTDHNGTTKYFYNAMGQIQKVEEPKKTCIYEYDKAGNRQSVIETYTSDQIFNEISDNEIKYRVKRSNYVYSNTNMLLELVESMSNASGDGLLQKITYYTYDKNGNQLTERSEYIQSNKVESSPIFKLSKHGDNIVAPIDPLIHLVKNEYDGLNRLKKIDSIKSGKRVIITYDYDGDALRTKTIVKKSTDGYFPQETNYLYDRQHVILETDKNGSVIERYVRGINYIARIDSQFKQSYYLYNGHGDVVQTVSQAGDIDNEYDYDIFGNVTLAKEKYANPIRYAGEFFDKEAGLYYLRARYYNPYVGRFISEDSYWGEDTNPLSLNLYTYCENNPIMYVDPTGHFGIVASIAAGRAVYHAAKSVYKAARKSKNSRKKKTSKSSRHSHSGASIGTAIGAVIGGPVGSTIGGSIGAAVETVIDETKHHDSGVLSVYNDTDLNQYIDPSSKPIQLVCDEPLFGVTMRNNVQLGPTLEEAAEIAQHVYFKYSVKKAKQKVLLGGWKLIDVYEPGSLRIGVYTKTNADRVKEYVLVNRGTQNWDWDADGDDNAKQLFGKSDDMKNSIEYAKKFVKKHQGANITFVGHSKGGAEAAANAVATNKNAIVFNPATVNLKEYDLDRSKYTGDMTAYIVKGEILDGLEGPFSNPIGSAVYLPRQYWNRPITNHSMDSVKKAIKEWKEGK